MNWNETYTTQEIRDALPDLETIRIVIDEQVYEVDGIAMRNCLPATPETVLREARDALKMAIETWSPDRDGVLYLRDWIAELKIIAEALEIKIEDVVDVADLPSAPFPADLAGYPVWAMDSQGNCLVGEAMDQIERIDDIQTNFGVRDL